MIVVLLLVTGLTIVWIVGGKDSLVSLDMALDAGYALQLLYVTDDSSSFESDWRLQGIVDTMKESTPLHLGIILC